MITRRGSEAYGMFVRSKQCQVNGSLSLNLDSALYIKFCNGRGKVYFG